MRSNELEIQLKWVKDHKTKFSLQSNIYASVSTTTFKKKNENLREKYYDYNLERTKRHTKKKS